MSFPIAEVAVVIRPDTAAGVGVNGRMECTLEKLVCPFLGVRWLQLTARGPMQQ